MKIAIDIQTTLGQPTGFGFYVSNLVRSLKEVSQEDEFVLIGPDTERDFSTPQRFIWDQFQFPAKAKKAQVELLHQPCFSAPIFYKNPVVVTIHDIISLIFPETIPFASRMFYSRWMPLSYRKAQKIIASSQSTKNDLMRMLAIPEEKITVISLAVDSKFANETSKDEVRQVKQKYNLRGDYLLHVGTLEPRKNLDFLIDVFARTISDKKNENLSLVITGKKGWYFEGLFEKVKNLGLENKVIFTGYVDEKDKPAIYKGAKIFTFPSLYEGFGLPPLEAVASQIPVISSSTSSMPEVLGDAGILLSPHDPKAWVSAISKVNSDSDLRQKMIEKNKEQLKKFSWEKTARSTIAVYTQAIEEYKNKKK
ncbi:MAG: glycosyltransferase family 1 protein [Candidatus Berkelbacteria bacterium]|nr:glycosyltransferase family 1 protein [Candidatus Berkelbacteria bacterium]